MPIKKLFVPHLRNLFNSSKIHNKRKNLNYRSALIRSFLGRNMPKSLMKFSEEDQVKNHKITRLRSNWSKINLVRKGAMQTTIQKINFQLQALTNNSALTPQPRSRMLTWRLTASVSPTTKMSSLRILRKVT